jgi:superfamily II DNA or RNA helicase
MQMDKINFYVENNMIKIDITGDWFKFVLPVKDKIKLRRYKWNKDRKIWTKELNDIRIKEQLKEEYNFIKSNFKPEYINFGNLKDYIIKLNEKQENFKNTTIEETSTNIESLPKKIFKKLLPHQIEGIRRFNLQHNQILLGWQMGLGKSFGSLAIVKSKNKNGIIIVPKSLISQWREEIIKWNICDSEEIYDCESNRLLNSNYKFYIFNYEKFRYLEKNIDHFTIIDKKSYEWLINIIPENFIVIFDETYKIKNYKSKLYKAFDRFRFNFNWYGIICLTGTPCENSLFYFYTLLNFVSKNTITWNEMETHFIYRPPYNPYEIRFKNLKYFNELANKILYRITKDEVKNSLPPISIQYRFVESTKQITEIKNILIEKSDTIFEIYSLLKLLDSYLKPNEELKYYDILKEYLEIEQKNKLEELYDILEEIGQDKVIIFTQYSKTKDWLVDKLKKDYNVKGIEAATKNKDEIKKEFLDGDLQIVISTDTWSYGISLNNIDFLINFDILPNPAKMAQRAERIHRLDSQNGKTVISLVGSVIEKDVYDIILNKTKISEISVEGTEEKYLMKKLEEKYGLK